MGEFSVSSQLAAPPDVVWRHAASSDGVNLELGPLLRMTFPADTGSFVDAWQPGVPLFRSWLLLFGLLPVEYDDLTFEDVEPGRRFLERSTLMSQRVWEHERTIEPASAGSRLTDRVRFEPRVGWLGPLYARIFRAVFRWRHRNLRRAFGA